MQNSYILAALCSMCFYGFSDVVFKLSARYGIPSHQFIILQTIFFLPSALLLGLVTNTIHIGIPFYYGMCAGVTLYFALLYFAISLNTGDVSVVAPVFRSSFVLSSALAILFLDEQVTIIKILAFALSVIAAFLLLSQLKPSSTKVSPTPKAKNTTRNLIIATVFMGVTGFIYKLGAIAGGNTISIVNGQAFIFFPLAFIACYVKEKKIVFVWKYLYLGFAAALCLFGGLFLLLEALKVGPASTIVPISQMSFVVSAITGIFLLKEKMSGKKVLGLACAIGAILLLSQ
jgi:transporter family protein